MRFVRLGRDLHYTSRMRVGLIADTHIPESGVKQLWPEIFAAFAGVDLILHAGDIMLARVLDDLERIAPVYAALGNHDDGLESDERVKPYHLLDLEGHRVALVHQFEWTDNPATAFNLDNPTGRFEELSEQFLGGHSANVVVFGDSHVERVLQFGNRLLVNPGSAVFPRNWSPRLGHIGFLTLERDKPPSAEICHLSNWRGRL